MSGESGAGKTESTKFMLNYLAAMSSQKSQNSSIQKKILETVPLLEVINNNNNKKTKQKEKKRKEKVPFIFTL